MSLATSGGLSMGSAGATAGGLTMAHQPNAMAQHRAAQPPPQPKASISGGPGAPPSAAALGADLIDKQQISLKQAKNTAHLPLVAVDLFDKEPQVAFYPPKPRDPSEGKLPVPCGKASNTLQLKTTEESHKTLRKFLNKSKTYDQLRDASLGRGVSVEYPQQWLGMRRTSSAADAGPVIAEDAAQVGVHVTNSTLDGSPSSGDDFDRVVLQVRLLETKKTISMLPEEAVQCMLHQMQEQVAKHAQYKASEDDDTTDLPLAIATPGWMMHDSALEALQDASSQAVVFHRSVCALAGAFIPGIDGKPNPVMTKVNEDRQQRARVIAAKKSDGRFEDVTTLILVGMTPQGIECTAIQVSELQDNLLCCLFGNFKVLSNVSIRSNEPLTKAEECLARLEETLKVSAPEAPAPAMLLTYGTGEEHLRLRLKSRRSWSKIHLVGSKPDVVAKGAAVLGAVSHGRVCVLKPKTNNKLKADLALRVQPVACVAVGVKINYFGGKASKWLECKTIFDFDRRVPAGPYVLECKAAECVLHRAGETNLSDDEWVKTVKATEAAKFIPEREEAALQLHVQVVQKLTRDGDWIAVGDPMEPLVKRDKDDLKVACESVSLQISLGVSGVLTTSLVGDRESVFQATKSARNSMLRYYLGIFAAILFFGGFLVKSYYEDHVFERDTKKLLVYYKHVIPGSISDGDEHNARYLVWKYRGNKDKLWKSLEKKYGEPVREADEWPEEEDGDTVDEDGNEEPTTEL